MQKKTGYHKFFKSLVFVVLLPAAMLLTGSELVQNRYREKFLQQNKRNVRKHLLDIRREADNESYIGRQLNFLFGLLNEEKINRDSIQKHLDKLRQENIPFVNIRFFDENARHIPLAGEPDTYRVFVQKIFSALCQPELQGTADLLKTYRSFFDSFLGNIDPAELAIKKSTLVRVKLNGKPGYFYWNSIYSHLENDAFKGGFIAFFEEAQMPDDFAIQRLLQRLNEQGQAQGATFGMLNLVRPPNSILHEAALKEFSIDPAILLKTLRNMRSQLISEKRLRQNILMSLQIDGEKELFALFKGQANEAFLYAGFLLKIFIAFVFLVIARLLANAAFAETGVNLVHDQRKAMLLVYVVAMPLVAMIFLAVFFIEDSQQLSLYKMRQELELYARNVDDGYQQKLKALEKQFRHFVNTLPEENLSDSVLLKKCSDFAAKNTLHRVFVLNNKGKIAFSWPENAAEAKLLQNIFPAIGGKIFAGRKERRSIKDKINSFVFDSYTRSFSDFLGQDENGEIELLSIFEKPDQLHEFSFAGKKHFIFSGFSENSRYLVFFWSDSLAFSRQYLEKIVSSSLSTDFKKDEVRFGLMPKTFAHLPYPREFNKYPAAISLREQVLRSGDRQSEVADLDGRKWLVLATPLESVPDYIFYALQPLEGLHDQKTLKTLALALFVGGYLAISRFILGAKTE